MKVTLTVTEGPHRGKVFEFREHDTFIVGRSKDAHFRLPFKDRSFSRNHFLVEINPPRCRIMDMASTNGTYVNGRKVETADLEDGDRIKGGKTVIQVSCQMDQEVPEVTLRAFPAGESLTPTLPPIPRYRIDRELGRGGMGVVYLARGEGGGPPVALKTITPAMAGGEQAMARFLREASILRRLDHPNIVAFREIGWAGGVAYFAMEYVPGTDADGLLKQHGGPLPVGRAVDLACQMLDALAYAHDRNFIHRDVKPPNLLVSRADGRDVVKLADFGLARTYQASALSGLSFAGQVSGSVGFMPPEQITDFRKARPAVDQYAAAATLYYLLTERKVYDFPPGVQSRLLMILQDEPIPIASRRPGLPPALAATIDRALARDPAARFPDVKAMQAALAPFRAPHREGGPSP